MSTATAEARPAVKDFRITRELVDRNGVTIDFAARQRECGIPGLPPTQWPYGMTGRSREDALAIIKSEQAKYEASGYDKQLDAYWARNSCRAGSDLMITRWRLVDWS
jgi:hypothetical protein